MGIWYTHNQTGSILGTVIPALFAHKQWCVIVVLVQFLCNSSNTGDGHFWWLLL